MSLKNILALQIKHLKDTVRNMQVLILFIVYPAICFIFSLVMPEEINQTQLFIGMFATMHFTFTPIVATTNFIAEEKEKNTLNVLILSNVSPIEYLISLGSFVLLLDMVTALPFMVILDYSNTTVIGFLGAGIMGVLFSVIVGLCIGIASKTMSGANGLAVPIGFVFAFSPMLGLFNAKVEKISLLLYGQHINYWIRGISFQWHHGLILFLNFTVLTLVYHLLYSRNRIERL